MWMKKTKIKTILLMLLILVVNINSFAAVVSDNDGSAFITKGEFDSLKNAFQAQLDRFNTSIDNKIETAIVSYLEGIDINERVTANIINSQWEEVSAINGALENTYKVPDFDFQFFLNSWQGNRTWTKSEARSTAATSPGGFVYIVFHYMRYNFAETSTDNWHVYRNLVETTKDYPEVGDIIWSGQAVRYKEKWVLSRLARIHIQDEDPSDTHDNYWVWLDRPYDVNYSIGIQNFTTLKQVGYVTNWDDVKYTGWPITYKWNCVDISGSGWTGTKNINLKPQFLTDNYQTSIEIAPDNDGKKIRYEHIITDKSTDEWRLSNPKWNNLINTSPENTYVKADDLVTAASKQSWARVLGVAHHVSPHQGKSQDITAAHTVTDNSYTPSLGLFIGLRRASVIYQDNVTGQVASATKKINKPKPTLPQGFQLLAAEKNYKIEWEPKFNYTHVHNSATTYQDNKHEVDIYIFQMDLSQMG